MIQYSAIKKGNKWGTVLESCILSVGMIWLLSSRTKSLRLGSHDFCDLQMNNCSVQSVTINIVNCDDDAEMWGVIVFTGRQPQGYSKVFECRSRGKRKSRRKKWDALNCDVVRSLKDLNLTTKKTTRMLLERYDYLWDLRLSHRRLWRELSSGL